MINIQLTFDPHLDPIFIVDDAQYTIREMARKIVEDSALPVTRIEVMTGVDHPKFYNIVKDKNRSLATLLQVMDGLGYQIKMQKVTAKPEAR